MGCSVFVSYARDDLDPQLETFFRKLTHELSLKVGKEKTRVFIDREAIVLGAEWKGAIAEGLRTSHVLLALVSPNMLDSDYCGREFQVFLDRRAGSPGPTGKLPSVVLPIIWEPPPAIPETVSAFQHDHASLPKAYGAEGLRYLLRLKAREDDYEDFITQLVKRIVAAAAPPLPELPVLPALDSVRSAWGPKTAGALAPPALEAVARGPANVRFVFIAATREEARRVRNFLEAYGAGGWDWRPFLPEWDEEIGNIATRAATKVRLRYGGELPVGPGLDQALAEARENNEIVVVFADAWSLRLQHYEQIARGYDKLYLANAGAFVFWNSKDPEAVDKVETLEGALHSAFPQKSADKVPSHFWGAASSSQDIESRLEIVLTELKMRVLEQGKARRRASSDTLTDGASAQGIDVGTTATLNVVPPGGA